MAPNVSVRTYKPRQQTFSHKKNNQTRSRFTLSFSSGQGKVMAALLAVTVVTGLGLTQFFHGQISDMRARAEQLRAKNASTANENVRLLAGRAQLASKTQVAALAATKLNLFEPDKGQVRRM
jgi:cell division protein FtsL